MLFRSVAAWVADDFVAHRHFAGLAIPIWNRSVELGFFILIAWIAGSLRIVLLRELAESWLQTQSAPAVELQVLHHQGARLVRRLGSLASAGNGPGAASVSGLSHLDGQVLITGGTGFVGGHLLEALDLPLRLWGRQQERAQVRRPACADRGHAGVVAGRPHRGRHLRRRGEPGAVPGDQRVLRPVDHRPVHRLGDDREVASRSGAALKVVEVRGFEPLTFSLRTRRSTN